MRCNSPILIVPYMWIGDFVRCHSVVKLLQAALSGPPGRHAGDARLCAPLDRLHARPAQGRRRRPAAQPSRLCKAVRARQAPQAGRLRHGAGHAADLEIGARAILRRHSRTDRFCRRGALFPAQRPALRRAPFAAHDRSLRGAHAAAAARLPPRNGRLPELKVPRDEVEAWRNTRGLDGDTRPVVALAPGAVGPSKRWPSANYAALARRLLAAGFAVWVLGGPDEKALATEIVGDTAARDLTGHDLRDAILALAAAAAAVSNDSGLLHVAAALGTPSIGIFGPTSPWHWAPLNPLAGTIETASRASLPAVPQAGLPPRPSPLHARHPAGSGCRRDQPRDCRRSCGRGQGGAA